MIENTNTTLTDENKDLTNPVDNSGKDKETLKTYTEEEVQAMLQREADKRVTDALKKAERKTADKVREAQRLAQMNEQEKYEYQLEQREKAIAEKERALALSENKNAASKILAEKGLSLYLVDFIVAEDAETMNQNINLLDKAFKDSVKAEVEKRLSSTTPKKNLPVEGVITKDSLKRMSIGELQELYVNNPELYNSLQNT